MEEDTFLFTSCFVGCCWLSFPPFGFVTCMKREEMREGESGKGRGGGRGRGWGSKKADKGGGRPAGVLPGLLVPHQLHNLLPAIAIPPPPSLTRDPRGD